MSLELRIASANEAGAIATLVNRAYRPSASDAGWTHETHLVAGDRITAAQVLALFAPNSVVLLLCDGAAIVACVHVQQGQPGTAYIGMLATNPALQAKGVGKQLLAHAETHAVAHFGAARFKMSVLSGRPELLAFYERRGYALTGEIGDYPVAAGVGEPLKDDMRVLSLMKASR